MGSSNPVRVTRISFMRYLQIFLLGLLLAVGLCSCGGSSKPVSVNVTPMSATLNPGGTQQFSANVTGGHSGSVTWNVNGTAGGARGPGPSLCHPPLTAPSRLYSP